MLKLAKLPDRKPVRITVTVSAELNQALADYQKVYAAAYGVSEKVAELIPFMLEAFLYSDRAFAKHRKEGLPEIDADTPTRRARSPRADNAAPAPTVDAPAPRPQED